MTDTIDLGRHEPLLDEKAGRYKVPGVDGRDISLQRVSNFLDLIANKWGIHDWERRMDMLGATQRPDLFAKFASLGDPIEGDKAAARKIVGEMKEAAKASAGANLGTALHTFTERVDRGEDVHVPAPWDADVAAYRQALDDYGIAVDPKLIERTVILDALGVAGTFDRMVTFAGARYIADLKTGKDPASYPHDICIQLALYAHADAMVDAATRTRGPMPECDHDRALVIHLPPGKARCSLYWFDIRHAWEMVDKIVAVRGWRGRSSLVTKLPAPEQRRLGLTPTPQIRPVNETRRDEWTPDEGDLLDPTTALPALTRGFGDLGIVTGSDLMVRWNAWVREGRQAHRDFTCNADNATRRRFRIYKAGARLLAMTATDEEAHELLVAAFGPLPLAPVGAQLGELTQHQAEHLAAVLAAINTGTVALSYDDNGVPHRISTTTI